MNDSAKYKQASEMVLNSLPSWKREAIKEDRINGNFDSRIMNEFVHEVVTLVEQEKTKFD